MAHILLIDDDEMVRFALSHYLMSEGHTVAEAVHGNDPIIDKYLTGIEPDLDLVITDIVMPEQDGLGCLMKFKRAKPELPVICMSGGGRISSEDYLETAEALSADAVFAKPVNEELLLAEITRLLTV